MVSLTTYTKAEIKVVLWTQIKDREYSSIHTAKPQKGESINQKEMRAMLLGLEHIKKPVELEIYTDSPWMVRAVGEWMPKWKQDGWKKSDGKPVANAELWKKIANELEKHKYTIKAKEK
ncbi:MAG: hypothetical protein PHY47_20625 [Lachnospiraceae bacterium]|nr:hypothetical protein [Lachnospiraceae bacterium]